MLTRRLFLGAVAATAAGIAGCGNFGALTYFLMPEQREEAKMKHLAGTDEKKKPKVVILTHAGMDLDTDFLHADREIADNLAREWKGLATAFKDKIDIVPQRQVEEYKNSHPNWTSQDLRDVGDKFKADYVIYLEIHSLSMKDRDLISMLRGNANLTIHLVDVKNPDDSPTRQPFNFRYPSEDKVGIPIDGDTHPTKFRQEFLRRLAHRLLPYFAKYPRSEVTAME